ncbi:hypothetical protein FRC17_003709 [Serendipita sp. 399]|nr:hypothetical protein FRC17_003709 [Serendipita sp. 399]
MESNDQEPGNVFYGDKRPEETRLEWLKRVMDQPLQDDLDEQVIQEKIEEIEKQRRKRYEGKNTPIPNQFLGSLSPDTPELMQDFYAACLELHAWAAARPLAEHEQAVGPAEAKVYECITEEESQTKMVEHLQAFAKMIQKALYFLDSNTSGEEVVLDKAEQDAGTAVTETPRVPQVLVPNSSP